MQPDDLLRYVRDVCNRLKLSYFVVGSTATITYGEPRFTNDIDVVVDLPAAQVKVFCQEFPSDEFYISEAAVADAVRRCFQFNVKHPSSGLKVDFMVLSDSAYDQSRRVRCRELPVLEDGNVRFAPPEDVILKKLVYYRNGGSDKHLRDIDSVLRIQGDRIDRGYIEKWASELQVEQQWNLIKALEQ